MIGLKREENGKVWGGEGDEEKDAEEEAQTCSAAAVVWRVIRLGVETV